jgi:hypothetical protein
VPWIIIFLCALFAACSGQIEGTFSMAAYADLKVSAELQPKTAALIRRLSTRAGATPPALLNAAALINSFSQLEGIEKVSFVNKSPNLVDGQLAITRIDELIAEHAGAGRGGGGGAGTGTASRRFITWEQNADGGRALIYLDRENGPKVLSFLSASLNDYLSSLLAPISTGEELSLVEYIDMVKSIYGEDIANEIAASRLRLRLKFPAKITSMVTSIQGGTSSVDTVVFDMPLIGLLVLEKPLSCEIKWGKQPQL